MTRGIFIAGNESALFNAVAAEAARRVEYFAAAPISSRLSGGSRAAAGGSPGTPAKLSGENRILLPWNPGSPVSTRGLILGAENRLERIDEALLICTPPEVTGPAATLDLTDIEIMAQDHIKGWFFLVKELASIFKARGGGTLALIAPEIPAAGSRDALPDLLGSAAAASFRAFTQNLLTASYDEPYQTIAFTAAPGEETSLAAFIFKTMEEPGKRNNGKWHKFNKLSLFNR